MDKSKIIEGLNDAQRDAVCATGNTMVLAGAGSGKTKVLTHRIAYVMAEGCTADQVLAVTFTKKAAGEMSERLSRMVGKQANGIWKGTFHSLAARILRSNAEAAGLERDFSIIDDTGQESLLRRLLAEMGLKSTVQQVRSHKDFINRMKENGRRSKDMVLNRKSGPKLREMHLVYKNYEQRMEQSSLVDYAELLLRCNELFTEHPDIANQYRSKFRHVLVDEFQDTNDLQYAFVRHLSSMDNCVFAVGDDDQSIYGFRGAKISNVKRFQRDYDADVVRLEQNYRSSGNILGAANSLIAGNTGRMDKKLWTSVESGEPLYLHNAEDDHKEADFVVQQIRRRLASPDEQDAEQAILYRINSVSRIFEDALNEAGILYRVYGGERFYEREEVRYALALAKILVSPDDDAAMDLVLSLDEALSVDMKSRLYRLSNSDGHSLWKTASEYSRAHNDDLAAYLRNKVEQIEALRLRCSTAGLDDAFSDIITEGGIKRHYKRMKGRGRTQLENLEELVAAAREHMDALGEAQPQTGLDVIANFITEAKNKTREEQIKDNNVEPLVTLSTIHSSKGLEFPHVYMVRMLEGVFPHKLSLDADDQVEEERRLCYVGVTRAQKTLTLSSCKRERHRRSKDPVLNSRFLDEFPKSIVRHITPKHLARGEFQGARPYRERRKKPPAQAPKPKSKFKKRLSAPPVLSAL